MTKKLILKWLDCQKSRALVEVEAGKKRAQESRRASDIEETGFDDLVAEIEPMLTAVYDKLTTWHEKHKEVCGTCGFYYGGLQYALQPYINSNRPLRDILLDREFHETPGEKQITTQFAKLWADVEKTYNNVSANVNALANAKLGLEYLKGLGFDVTELIADDEKPVEKALAVPINTAFLFLKQEETHGSTDL